MTYINHITLHTGHNRRSPRSEVSDETMARMAPLMQRVDVGEICTLTDDYEIRRLDADADGRHTRQWAVARAGQSTFVVMALAMKSRPGAALWRHLQATLDDLAIDAMPTAPWLAVYWDLQLSMYNAGALHWLGDAERCIAWAWIESVYTDGQ